MRYKWGRGRDTEKGRERGEMKQEKVQERRGGEVLGGKEREAERREGREEEAVSHGH